MFDVYKDFKELNIDVKEENIVLIGDDNKGFVVCILGVLLKDEIVKIKIFFYDKYGIDLNVSIVLLIIGKEIVWNVFIVVLIVFVVIILYVSICFWFMYVLFVVFVLLYDVFVMIVMFSIF